MPYLDFSFEILKSDKLPSALDVVSLIRQHTQLNIKYKSEESYPGSGVYIPILSYPDNFSERIYFFQVKDLNDFILNKSFPDFTYLFHSTMYVLSKLTIEFGGGYIESNIVEEKIPLYENKDIEKVYQKLNLPLDALEAAMYPYEIAKTMKGCISRINVEYRDNGAIDLVVVE